MKNNFSDSDIKHMPILFYLKGTIFLLIALLFFSKAYAQRILSIEEAISEAFNNNPNIHISKNMSKIAENNVDRGNAGMLPTITLSGSSALTVNDTKLEFAGEIPPADISGAQNISNSAGLNMNYVLFDGMKMFNTYKRLQFAFASVDAESKMLIEDILLQTIYAYNQLVLASNQLRIAQEALTISRERMSRAKSYFEMGGSSSLEYLSAQVDYNADSTILMNAETNFKTNRRNLDFWMGADIGDYQVVTSISFAAPLVLSELKNAAEEKNVELRAQKFKLQMAEFDKSISRSNFLPTLSLNAGYNYNRAVNEAGILLLNQTNGYNMGVTFSYNIFNGNRNNIAHKNAQVMLENETLQLDEFKRNLNLQIENTFDAYSTQLALINVERSNLATAESNFKRSQELHKLGQITNTQFREAQLNLSRAQNRLIESAFTAKVAEMELLRLAGELIPED